MNSHSRLLRYRWWSSERLWCHRGSFSCSDICNGNPAVPVQREVTGSDGDQASGLISSIYRKTRCNACWESACGPPPCPGDSGTKTQRRRFSCKSFKCSLRLLMRLPPAASHLSSQLRAFHGNVLIIAPTLFMH